MLYSFRATVSALFRLASRRPTAKRAAAISVVGLPLAAATLASIALTSSACVDVPDSVHAQFAAARPDERSNFRKGAHGLARPEASPAVSAAPIATTSASATDAGACTGAAPCAEKPSDKSADAKTSSAPDASTTTTTSAALDGGSP